MNKKTARKVLGRGLSALIPTTVEEENGPENEIVEISVSAIATNPFQPRKEFNKEEITSLAESISTHGLLQPILVRQKSSNEYEIISGERRFRALKSLGKDKAPCVIRQKVSDREMMEVAIVENVQREDLNEMEKADAYQQLILDHEYSHEALAKQIGKSRTAITNTLRLLNLPAEIQQMVRDRKISMGHARALLALEDNQARLVLANRCISENLSVRDIEKISQTEVGPSKKKSHTTQKQHPALDPNLADVINKLQYKLGTPVTIKPRSGETGTVEISYFSDKDLTRIVECLLLEK